MGQLSNYVSLAITRDTVGISLKGFGVLAILTHKDAFPERVRYYSDLPGVGDDFATDSPEYLMAETVFSQNPRPSEIAIIRGDAAKPTQEYRLEVANVRPEDYVYEIEVKGEGVTEETASYTVQAGDGNTEIMTGLVAALNGITGKNYTAVDDGGGISTVTADAAGGWFSLKVKPADLSIRQEHGAPAGLADELNAIVNEQPDWYGLVSLFNSRAYAEALADWAESNGRLYTADSVDTRDITTAVGSGGLIDSFNTNTYARSSAWYHPDPSAFLSGGVTGRVLPTDPGSASWAFKSLKAVPAVALTPTQRKNLTDRNGNSYETVAGINITFDGKTSDGDFIDVQRGLDWLDDDMRKEVFGIQAGSDKIPFTDAGVGQIESGIRASLRRGVGRGVLAPDPEPEVTVPQVADVSSADKGNRNLPDVKFSGTLAGAVHKVNISGVVSV